MLELWRSAGPSWRRRREARDGAKREEERGKRSGRGGDEGVACVGWSGLARVARCASEGSSRRCGGGFRVGEVALNCAGGEGWRVRARGVGDVRGCGALGPVWQCVVCPPIDGPLLAIRCTVAWVATPAAGGGSWKLARN
jgi:hypothetical protein